MSKLMTAIGMMSGTSMDGIDVALIRSDGECVVERGPASSYPYEAKFREQLEDAMGTAKQINTASDRPDGLNAIEQLITAHHRDAALKFIEENGLSKTDIDLIGFHGQTVLHRPEDGLTVQLGDGQSLAESTGLRVVYNIRVNDMRAGGQGAPLIPVYHQALTASLAKEYASTLPVCFVNIGGISNISYIGEQDELLAFDTGPGNALIDQWVQLNAGIPYDQGGMIAAEGAIDAELVAEYLSDPFFERNVPKSLDRFDFQMPASERINLEDGARSLARVSAEAILKSCDHLPAEPKLWIICGGGRHNPSIMRDLKELAEIVEMKVISAEDAGFDGDAMEAEAWGYLAIRSVKGLPLTFPGTTGCRIATGGGLLAAPKR